MKTFYDDGNVKLIWGDSREILPTLNERFDAIITDPVWPNVPAGLIPGSEDPNALFTDVMRLAPQVCGRLVVQLGCDSDPRFLQGVPPEMDFLRVHWLEYACPHYKGRVLYTSDVAYVYGAWPKSEPGKRVIPGRTIATGRSDALSRLHPCPRKVEHVRYLVRWYAEDSILDPFAGSGTTLIVAKEQGLRAVGIEINEEYAELAARRLELINNLRFNEVEI